jgi:uncharacterized membrane protein
MKLFNDEPVNVGRQIELDWARGFAVIFMILVHVKMVLPGFPLSDSYSRILEFAGSPLAAPTFMILLGAGIAYSRNNEPKKQAVHGLKLFALHYALNFAAFGIPFLIMLMRTQDGVYREEFFNYLLGVDILAFAGLTFLFFALSNKWQMKPVHIIYATLSISCLNYVFTWMVSNYWSGPTLGLLVRANEYSFFPFMSWIGYPVMGYIFGGYLKRCTDKKRFYQHLFAFSILTVATITMGSLKYGFNIWSMHFGPDDYYYQDFIQYILVGGICFSWISVLYALSKLKVLGFVGKHLSRWSRNTTAMYCTQWMIIGWISVLSLIVFPADPLVNFITGVAVVILSDGAATLYKRFFTI